MLIQVRGLGGNDQLAHAPVRHAALAAIAVEQAAPFYAAARFQRARRVIHVGVDDVDKMVASITDGGGAMHVEPQDIPGVGRFAMVADPQGASFYVMRSASDKASLSFASDMPRVGHCAWNELSTSDQAAAHHFYGQRFGWVQDGDMDMGPLGKYDFLRHGDGMIGAIMPKIPEMPVSAWTYYFRVADIDAAQEAIEMNGGSITQPPIEIPGGDLSLCAIDPQGASFGLVGARKG